jgi:hypothetical protein
VDLGMLDVLQVHWGSGSALLFLLSEIARNHRDECFVFDTITIYVFHCCPLEIDVFHCCLLELILRWLYRIIVRYSAELADPSTTPQGTLS